MNRLPQALAVLVIAALISASAHAQTFTDVTPSAGVANSVSGAQRVPTSGAWGDYDGDGDLDLYVTNWAASVSNALNRLYRNDGGTFTDVAGPLGVADPRNSVSADWVDYDQDGDLDLYVVNFFEQDQLYRNDGGTFTRVTGAAAVNTTSQGDETGSAWGDYDGDGYPDLYICKQRFQNSLYHNNGDGTFTEVAASAGVDDLRDSFAAAWADADGDGDLDLYVVNREQANSYYRNNGNGRFSSIACAISVDNTDVGRSAEWIDFDSDGDLDLFVANIGANALYRNDGADTFVDIAEGPLKSVAGAHVSWSAAWADFDGDGLLDVFIANGAETTSGQRSHLLRNSGSEFVDITADAGLRTTASNAMQATAVDYDGDGDVDLYVVNSRYPSFEANVLYRNER